MRSCAQVHVVKKNYSVDSNHLVVSDRTPHETIGGILRKSAEHTTRTSGNVEREVRWIGELTSRVGATVVRYQSSTSTLNELASPPQRHVIDLHNPVRRRRNHSDYREIAVATSRSQLEVANLSRPDRAPSVCDGGNTAAAPECTSEAKQPNISAILTNLLHRPWNRTATTEERNTRRVCNTNHRREHQTASGHDVTERTSLGKKVGKGYLVHCRPATSSTSSSTSCKCDKQESDYKSSSSDHCGSGGWVCSECLRFLESEDCSLMKSNARIIFSFYIVSQSRMFTAKVLIFDASATLYVIRPWCFRAKVMCVCVCVCGWWMPSKVVDPGCIHRPSQQQCNWAGSHFYG